MSDHSEDFARLLTAARGAQKTLQAPQMGPEHLLAALFTFPHIPATRALLSRGLTFERVMARLEATTDKVPAPGNPFEPAPSPMSPELRKIIETGTRLHLSLGEEQVATIARALFASETESVDAILRVVGTSSSELIAGLTTARAEHPLVGTAGPALPTDAGTTYGQPVPMLGTPGAAARGTTMTSFTRDLTAEARAGRLDPVIGRDKELARVGVVLARRSKNNPVLVGEPGVGKTAIVEGLATSIVDGSAPARLHGMRVLAVDLGAMLAGTKFRGDFEERFKALVTEARAAGDVILFLDEIHQLSGAGSSGGGMDAATMVKESLARGEISLIGATTMDEYRTHIEKDAALERRFQPVVVTEPSLESTTAILNRLAPKYGEYHGVTYSDDVLTAAVTLSDRYLRDRNNPDKAIDVIDEAGARLAVLATPTTNTVPAVTVAHVAAVVSEMAGVPVAMPGQAQLTELAGLEDTLGARLVGQDAAVRSVAKAVRRRRLGLDGAQRPASFLFAGPTGVGKSELAKALSDVLFTTVGGEARGKLLQFDMGEFGEKHTVARLIGAPPGYTGHESGGQLTEAVRRNPYAVLLLDEVDKAHTDVFDALLQILEDGRLTDGQGRVVDFRHTIVILTSNHGARDAARGALGFGPAGGDANVLRDKVTAAVKQAFRPELLNRLDEVIVFERLTRTHLETIVESLLKPLRTQLAERSMTLEVTPDALSQILDAGYDPALGARPLRRAVTNMLTDPIADALVTGDIGPGDHVLADAGHGACTVAAVKVPALVPA